MDTRLAIIRCPEKIIIDTTRRTVARQFKTETRLNLGGREDLIFESDCIVGGQYALQIELVLKQCMKLYVYGKIIMGLYVYGEIIMEIICLWGNNNGNYMFTGK